MWKILLYKVYITFVYVPPTYRRVKHYDFSLSIKTYVSPKLVETEMRFISGAGRTLLQLCLRIIAFCYNGLMFYILEGGQVYPVPPFFLSGSLLCSLQSCLSGQLLAGALLYIYVPD